jgi:rubrerythrin
MRMGFMACSNDDAHMPAIERSVMATHHTTACHYLELLNNIASGERRAGVFLQAWADTTPDPELRACLSIVAHRETSHYHVFKRRIAELGYPWTDTQDPDFEERLQVSGSAMLDVEKIRWGRARQAQRRGPTIRERYEAAIADETVDPLTRSLLRWFADVEADSGTRLRALYDRIEAQAG